MLKTTIAGIDVDTCIYNASGPRSGKAVASITTTTTTTINITITNTNIFNKGTKEALEKIAESRSGVVLSKSCTLNEQKGNPLPRSINSINVGNSYCHGSLNSEGTFNIIIIAHRLN